MALSAQQIYFFETFGFLMIPNLLSDDIGWITDEFTTIHNTASGPKHDGTKRTCIVPFIDQSSKLCTLLDNPKIIEIAASLLGADFNYLGGDGNYYTGDTGWHSDGWHDTGLFIKMALYLDPVRRDSGCLRVIPGSQLLGNNWLSKVRDVSRSREAFGIEPSAVPAVPLESNPGDLVVFNHNLHHAAFGGSNSRRMFTLNLSRHAETEPEIADLTSYINSHGRFWLDQLHSRTMRETASPERMRHLQQIIELEGGLAEASARCRASMTEPSRG